MSFARITPWKQNIRPGFLGDFLSREHVLPGGIKLDASTFYGEDAVKAVVGAAGALANATSVPVAALADAIPSGTLLDFGGKKFARLSAAAAAGATSLAVDAIPTALVSGDTAYYLPEGTPKRAAAGTPVYIALSDFEAGANGGAQWKYCGPGVTPHATTDIVRILAFDVTDVDANNDGDILRPGTLIKINHLPEWDNLDAATKVHLRAQYQCTVGAPGQETATS